MESKTTDKQDKNDEKPNWRNFVLWLVGTILLVAIFAVVMPEQIPSLDDLCGYPCCSELDMPQQIVEQLTEQGYVLYVYGGCHWCDEQLSEFGNATDELAFVDCGIAHQAYIFENLSEAEEVYNWIYLNGSLIKAMNLTYENNTIEYDGYGILGYANKNPECASLNISGYPTWISPNGTHIIGYRSLDVIEGWVE
jgi:hypothetical protein